MDEEYLTLQEAAKRLGIGRQTLWRRMKAGKLPIYQSEIDRRTKLVKLSDLEALRAPRLVEIEVAGKAAA